MIRFPTTPEAFISDQEQLLGRKLAENEREVIAALVKVFNLFYEGGLCPAIKMIRSYTNLPKRAVFG